MLSWIRNITSLWHPFHQAKRFWSIHGACLFLVQTICSRASRTCTLPTKRNSSISWFRLTWNSKGIHGHNSFWRVWWEGGGGRIYLWPSFSVSNFLLVFQMNDQTVSSRKYPYQPTAVWSYHFRRRIHNVSTFHDRAKGKCRNILAYYSFSGNRKDKYLLDFFLGLGVLKFRK